MFEEPIRDTEWWWIDYLENEMATELEHDLQTLLHHSQEDRDSFEHFRLLREWVSASDPIADWPLEECLLRIRRQVMSVIRDQSAPEVTKALST